MNTQEAVELIDELRNKEQQLQKETNLAELENVREQIYNLERWLGWD